MTPKTSTTAGGVLGVATIATGLIAGTFYIFVFAVMPALARGDDRTYIQVMRDIDDVITNPVFLLTFNGALLLTAIAVWQSRGTPYLRWTWAAFLAYALNFLVTVAFNIPLNNDLHQGSDWSALREDFEDPWVAWNAVRTVFSTLALGFLARTLVLYGRRRPSS
ncbi:DUF1772 domain-containing protein [Streptomyces lincolnensis]|uniref:DUF1772 domain-containing protein n=1 Tax=Streptomyces lincolnensis TaxID=1915 RepID=UPI0037D7C986